MTKVARIEIYNKTREKLEIPMLGATVLLLAIIIIQESFELPGQVSYILGLVDVVVWLLFVGELLVLTYLSPSRLHYLRSHWYDVLIVFIPFLRIFRLFRITFLVKLEETFLSAYKVLAKLFGSDTQLFRVFPLVAKFGAAAKELILKHKLNYLIAIFVTIVFLLGSLASVFEQRDPSANITNVYEGVWWGIVSVTTVGYGDTFPVTLQGRLIGAVMMTLGVIIFSLLTANLASMIVEDVEREERKEDRTLMNKKLEIIEEKVERLIEDIEHPNA